MSDLVCVPTRFPEVKILRPKMWPDARGFFRETFNAAKLAEVGIQRTFCQDNHSRSVRGVLRGLHYQVRYPQAKLVTVVRGTIFDVVVDIRRGSPVFGQHESIMLSDENQQMLFVPEGFAHGFCVLSDVADVLYKCTDYYHADDDGGLLWSDPGLGISWPIKKPILSAKDQTYLHLTGIAQEKLPCYQPSAGA
ncbi:MAG: dTDP-4-dehydrorhamnose 3,5-epimerase [Verrucomicrobia bacterium]|nr:MAG: dTDP-4-dehydrorhamnose 3,5-epimerase [Verrucomicrobiota bacterium]